MTHPLLDVHTIETTPERYLPEIGTLFAVFDEQVQDSGNISYGVEIDDNRYFVKTAGHVDDPKPYLSHAERAAYLHNAILLRESSPHPAIPSLHQVIESPAGPIVNEFQTHPQIIISPRLGLSPPLHPTGG